MGHECSSGAAGSFSARRRSGDPAQKCDPSTGEVHVDESFLLSSNDDSQGETVAPESAQGGDLPRGEEVRQLPGRPPGRHSGRAEWTGFDPLVRGHRAVVVTETRHLLPDLRNQGWRVVRQHGAAAEFGGMQRAVPPPSVGHLPSLSDLPDRHAGGWWDAVLRPAETRHRSRKRLIASRCWARFSGLRTPSPSSGARVSTPTLPWWALRWTSRAAWPTSSIGYTFERVGWMRPLSMSRLASHASL